MEILQHELRQLIKDAAIMGGLAVVAKLGLIRSFMSKNQAEKFYGRSTVKRWLQEGSITAVKDGENSSKIRIDLIDLEAAAKADNLTRYFE